MSENMQTWRRSNQDAATWHSALEIASSDQSSAVSRQSSVVIFEMPMRHYKQQEEQQ
jgi:hypothetical protein